jgi:hypothetical protein
MLDTLPMHEEGQAEKDAMLHFWEAEVVLAISASAFWDPYLPDYILSGIPVKRHFSNKISSIKMSIAPRIAMSIMWHSV